MKNRDLTERLVVMIDKPLRLALDKEQERSGAPIAEIVRRALQEYLADKKKQQ